MRSLDTNIIVRVLVRDDIEQARIARRIIEDADSLHVSETVCLECEWVLRTTYKQPRDIIVKALRKFLGLPSLKASVPLHVYNALDLYEKGFDFGDALHILNCPADAEFVTFDKELHRKAWDAGYPVLLVR